MNLYDMYKLIKIWIFIKSVVTNAIIIADKNIYDGANEHLIREVLVKRGILFPPVVTQAKVEPLMLFFPAFPQKQDYLLSS